MRITQLKRIFICAFLFFTLYTFNVFSQTRISHIDSDSIYNFFETKGFKPQILPNRSRNTVFPYSMVFDFSKKSSAVTSQSQTAAISDDEENLNEDNTLIIALTQSSIPLFLNELSAYMEQLKKYPPPINIKIVLTAEDTSAIRLLTNEQNSNLEGTEIFLSSLDTRNNYTALILDIRNSITLRNRNISVTPGITYKAAPSWLISAVMQACEKQNIPLKIDGLFISFYRAGLIQSNQKLEAYFNENIPALLLECSSAEIFETLPAITETVSNNSSNAWDYHYSMFAIGGKTFFIPEIVLLIILLITAAFVILDLCIISLLTKYSTKSAISSIKKSWILVPLMIIITWVLFFAGQIIAKKIYPNWRFHLFSACILKTSIALMLFLIVSLAHRLIHFPTNDYAYAWLLIIISFANIFIFASLDLSLLMIFSVEMILALIFAKLKHVFPMILISILMILPFISFAYAVLAMPRQNILYRFFNASFAENALIACLILPVEFSWIRIAVKLGIFGKKYKKGKFPYFIAIGFLIAIAVSAGVIGYSFLQNRITLPIRTQTEQPELNSLSFETKRSKIMNRNRIDLQINSVEMLLKLDIKVSTENGVAVYDANFPFESINSNHSVKFILGEYPPNPFTVQFTCDENEPITIEVTAYLMTKNRRTVQETKTITVEPIGDNYVSPR